MFITSHVEHTYLGNGLNRNVIAMKPVAVLRSGNLVRSVLDWATDGADQRIDLAPLPVRTLADGTRRLYPMPTDPAAYVEFGRMQTKPTGTWAPFTLPKPTVKGQSIAWECAEGKVDVVHGGHFCSWEFQPAADYKLPSDQFAVNLKLVGLTRVGDSILYRGIPVAYLRAPTVVDKLNPLDVRVMARAYTTIRSKQAIVYTLPSLVGMGQAVADPTLVLQPGASDGKDACIVDGFPSRNYGVTIYICIGNENTANNFTYHQLLDFNIAVNLASIPANATLTSVQAALFALIDRSSNADTYRVYRLKHAWVEGTKDGAIDTDGVTWDTYDGVNTWPGGAGGFGASDCEQTAIGSRDFTVTETLNEFKTFVLTPTTKTELDLSYGWLWKADTEADDAYLFASSDHATAAYRPMLTVEYTVANPSPGRFWALRGLGGLGARLLL